MHFFAAAFLSIISIITPSRTWYPPTQPMNVAVKSEADAQLVLTDFAGKVLEPKAAADFKGEKTFDLRTLWPQVNSGGTYILFQQIKGKPPSQFEGTPMLIEVRVGKGQQEVDVARITPLEYAVMTTDQGAMTIAFYYDVAPLTIDSFLSLSRTGYYEGLKFHRIMPGFMIQGGDPKGDGSGGPGYTIPHEFNDHPHLEGVLSMARTNDPDSGGSQFFMCLDYSGTKSLDHQYTAFGRVVAGIDVLKKLGATPLKPMEPGERERSKPVNPPAITKMEVKPVTATDNPYAEMFHLQ